jgi:hypothetical protein
MGKSAVLASCIHSRNLASGGPQRRNDTRVATEQAIAAETRWRSCS